MFRGPVFRVERDLVTLPNGRAKAMDIVRHRGSVVLIPEPAPGEVILIRQYRYAIRKWIWELPAGSVEPGERPAAAARRECAEEIDLAPGTVRLLGEFFPTPGFCDERMLFYRCTDLRRPARPVAGDPDEQIEPRTMTIAAAWRMVARREIIDMKTVLGLTLLEAGRADRPAGPQSPRSRR
jgi:ADP-ribose pyrophosphatase